MYSRCGHQFQFDISLRQCPVARVFVCGQVICCKHGQDKFLFLVVIEHLQLYSTAHCFLSRQLFLDKKGRQYCYVADALFRTELRKGGSTGFKTFVGCNKLLFWTQFCVTARHFITRLLF